MLNALISLETFLNAAIALNADYYLVGTGVRALGYWDDDSFRGCAMLQADIKQDYLDHVSSRRSRRTYSVPPAFVHHNMLKLVPGMIFGKTGSADYTRRMRSGEYTRIWGPKEDSWGIFGEDDLEKVMWEVVETVTCEIQERGYLEEGHGWSQDACEQTRHYMSTVLS